MDVKASVQSELEQLPKSLRAGPLAATALLLAELMSEATPRDAATLSKELRQTLADLKAAAKATKPTEVDPVDELAKRRAGHITASAPDRAAAARQRRPGGDRPSG